MAHPGDFAPEKAELNQYWYSAGTISALTSGALQAAAASAAARGQPAGSAGRIAFLSTPSLFFSLPEAQRAGHSVLDLDMQWAQVPGFVRFDFTEEPAALPAACRGAYDVVVIDPPFITEPVWRSYAAHAQALLVPGGSVLCTTVAENAGLLAQLFPGCAAVPFQPSIPRLVYQYNTFTTAVPVPEALAARNPEIPE